MHYWGKIVNCDFGFIFCREQKAPENHPSLGIRRKLSQATGLQLFEPDLCGEFLRGFDSLHPLQPPNARAWSFPQRICLSSHWKKRTLCHERARGGMADAPDLGSGSERI